MKRAWFSYPYIVWMGIFIVVPLLLVLFYSFTVQTEEGVRFSLEHIVRFWDPLYLVVLLRSVTLALVSTAICLVVGYPVAYILSRPENRSKGVLVLLFVIPMWMNFLLRTYAWLALLEKNGLINGLLSLVGIPPINMLYTNQAVVLGMVYNFLPFMILPVYSVLTKIDRSIIEAAEDLGANGAYIFRKVVLPLSLPGVMSGITMVFMPALTTFVISRLLGGGQYTLIGNLIERQFILVGDWNFGSALSFVMMVLILVSMAIMSKYDGKDEEAARW